MSALQEQPVVNAVIDGDDIIYRDYVDISIAVGTQKVGNGNLTIYNYIGSFIMFYHAFEDLYVLSCIG